MEARYEEGRKGGREGTKERGGGENAEPSAR
jgi:hypothetical protein